MVIRLPDGRETALDFRKVAPASSLRDVFLDDEGDYVPERHAAATWHQEFRFRWRDC
jgi:gamma-glutamyltranspeptidase